MWIQLKLYGGLKQYLSVPRDLVEKGKLEAPDGATTGAVLKALNVPDDLRIVTIVNGSHSVDRETVLKDGDIVLLYPLISGG